MKVTQQPFFLNNPELIVAGAPCNVDSSRLLGWRKKYDRTKNWERSSQDLYDNHMSEGKMSWIGFRPGLFLVLGLFNK